MFVPGKTLTSETGQGNRSKLLDVASVKFMFPDAAKEPRVLNYSKPHMKERGIREDTKKHTSGKKHAGTLSIKGKPSQNQSIQPPLILRSASPTRIRSDDHHVHREFLESIGITSNQMRLLEQADEDVHNAAEFYLKAFEMYDKDGSGDISPDELRQVLISLDENEEEFDDIIAQADADGDGVINYEEFVNMMKARKRANAMTMALLSPGDRRMLENNTIGNMSNSSPLPPLKLPMQQESRKAAKRRPRPEFAWMDPNSDRRPNVKELVSSNKDAIETTHEQLVRELAMAQNVVKDLDKKVKKDVEWVKQNCNVTSIRAQMYCKRWGMQKLENILKRLEFKDIYTAWRVWVKFVLWKRNTDQVEQYMKFKGSRRLTYLFTNWKRKKMIAAFATWQDMVWHQIRMEQNAGAIEIQRMARGFLARLFVLRIHQATQILTIQRIARGYLARRRVYQIRNYNELSGAATMIQRAYRKYNNRRILKLARLFKKREQAVTVLQRFVRRALKLKLQRIMIKQRQQNRAATKIEKVFRGHVARRVMRVQQIMIAENIAALMIQTCFRGYHGWRLGQALLETRMQCVAENEAALVIQAVIRGSMARSVVNKIKQERGAVKLQAKWRGFRQQQKIVEERQQAERQATEHAAVMIQSVARKKLATATVAEMKREKAAVTKIQSMRRGQLGRRDFENRVAKKQQNDVATTIQAKWRGHKVQTRFKKQQSQSKRMLETQMNAAATMVQAWHRGNMTRETLASAPPANSLEASLEYMQQLEFEELEQAQKEHAATLLQASIRGRQDRKLVENMRRDRVQQQERHDATVKIQSAFRSNQAQREVEQRIEAIKKLEESSESLKQQAAAVSIQSHFRGEQARKEISVLRERLLSEDSNSADFSNAEMEHRKHSAAIRIQTVYRGFQDRKRVQRIRDEYEMAQMRVMSQNVILEHTIAAVKIQSTYRGYKSREHSRRLAAQRAMDAKLSAEELEKVQETRRIEEARRKEEETQRKVEAEAKRKAEAEAKRKQAEIQRRQEAERKAEEARLSNEEQEAARKLQSLERGRQARKEVEEIRENMRKEAERRARHEEMRKIREAREKSALRIQCFYRSYRTKRLLRLKQEALKAKLTAQRQQQELERELKMLEEEQQKVLAVSQMQIAFREKAERERVEAQEKERQHKKQIKQKRRFEAACRIQAIFRGRRERRKYVEMARSEKSKKTEKMASLSQLCPDEPEKKDNWVEYWDDASQAYYYFNTITHEARWTDPRTDANGYETVGSITDYDTDNQDGQEPSQQQQQGYYDEFGNWVSGYYDNYGNWVGAAPYFNAPFGGNQQQHQQNNMQGMNQQMMRQGNNMAGFPGNGGGMQQQQQMGRNPMQQQQFPQQMQQQQQFAQQQFAPQMQQPQQQFQQQNMTPVKPAGGIDPNFAWEQYFDETYHMPYYFNISTGETSWEPPAGYVSHYASPDLAPRYR